MHTTHWSEPLTMFAGDNGDIWSKHNPWMREDPALGGFDCTLEVRMESLPGSPVVSFEPFLRDGLLQGGFKPDRTCVTRNTWVAFCREGTRDDKIPFKGSYRRVVHG